VHQQQKSKKEEEMIGSCEDVFKAEDEIIMNNAERARTLRDSQERIVSAQNGLDHTCISKVNTEQRVCLAFAQALNADTFTYKTPGAAVNSPALGYASSSVAGGGGGQSNTPVRKHGENGRGAGPAEGHSPQHLHRGVSDLPNLQQRGIERVGSTAPAP
jgi:hypothetical protein